MKSVSRFSAVVAVPLAFFSILLAASSTASAFGRKASSSSNTSQDPDPAAVIASLTPAQGAGLRMSIDKLSGFSSGDKTKVQSAVSLAQAILNSEQFHQAVLDFTYQGQRQFAQNDLYDSTADNVVQSDLSNEQIYETIQNGAEQLADITPIADRVANLDLSLYSPPWYNKWGTVGYGNPGEPQIYMNVDWFRSYGYAGVADNVTHEWTHKLGFVHDYSSTARRPYSVPYGIGCIVQQMALMQPVDKECYN